MHVHRADEPCPVRAGVLAAGERGRGEDEPEPGDPGEAAARGGGPNRRPRMAMGTFYPCTLWEKTLLR